MAARSNPSRLSRRARRAPCGLAAATIAVALLGAACTSGSSGSAPPPDRGTATADASTPIPDADATPTAVPTPTPTPEPRPVLLPPRLDPGGGLWDLRVDRAPGWSTTGVTIDGVLRAVSRPNAEDPSLLARVWIPDGTHEVCVGGVADATAPVFWDAGTELEPLPAASDTPGPDTASATPPTIVSTTPTPLPTPTPTPTPEPTPAPPPPALTDATCITATGALTIPATLLPGHRIIAHYGTGITSALGILGEGPVDAATSRLLEATAAYDDFGLPTIPAFEFIATVAQGSPGSDGSYSLARPAEEVRAYLEAIRAEGGLVFIDLQPGRTPFIEQVELYLDLLREPDVHLALDPEWSMRADQVPGRSIGSTDAATVNQVLDRLQGLVIEHGLPQKVLIVHQFLDRMVRDRPLIEDPAGLAVMFHIDGQGPVGAKYTTYETLFTEPPFFNGFKVFFDEDSRVLTPAEVVALDPAPVYVSYQ